MRSWISRPPGASRSASASILFLRSPTAGIPRASLSAAELPPESKGVTSWTERWVRAASSRLTPRSPVPPEKNRMRGPWVGSGKEDLPVTQGM
ncbi:MAG: hypothetical protein Q8N53_09020 [Longimicrobiales bacterium]|nr:hypothetical protein [Longimicrobiales bacterium]